MHARIAVLLVFASAPALAASLAYDRCIGAIDPAGFTNSQRLDCATKDMDRADAALDAVYRATMARLPGPRQTALHDAERRWVEQRRSNCALERQPADPSQDVNRMLCLVRETDARTEAIQAGR